MTTVARAALALTFVLVASGPARAGKLCLTYPTHMSDAGVGEDHWTSNGHQPLQYVSATITRASQSWTGNLDRSGCVSQRWIGARGDYGIQLTTKAAGIRPTLGGAGVNALEVRDAGDGGCAGNCAGTLYAHDFGSRTLEAFALKTLPLDDASPDPRTKAMFSALQLGTYGLSVDAGGNRDRTFKIQLGDKLGCRNSILNPLANGDIELGNGCAMSKFILIHELGHAVNWAGTTGGTNASPYRWDEFEMNYAGPVSENCKADKTSHAMWTVEWGLFAHVEGLAQAYAAGIWNDRRGPDCWVGYYKPFDDLKKPIKMSCTSANPTVAGRFTGRTAYMNEACELPADKTGKGNEYDWMRTWVHVLFDRKSPSDMGAINSFIKSGAGWTCGSSVAKPSSCTSYSFWEKLLTGKAGVVKTRLAQGGARYGVNH
jgi:hypothetical protein